MPDQAVSRPVVGLRAGYDGPIGFNRFAGRPGGRRRGGVRPKLAGARAGNGHRRRLGSTDQPSVARVPIRGTRAADGRSGLARRSPRRHRRGNAPRPARRLFRRRHGPAGRDLRPHQGLVRGVRPRADDRHAHLRGRVHRGLDRHLRHRLPNRRRSDDQRFSLRGRQPDRAPGCKAPLHEQRTAQRADGHSLRHGHGEKRRAAPQRVLPSGLVALPWPDRRHPLQPGRRQGLVQDRLAGIGSGGVPGTQVAAVDQGARAGGRTRRALRRGQDSQGGHGLDGGLLRPVVAPLRGSGRAIGRRGHILRSDRPADYRSAGHRRDRHQRGQDRAGPGGRRGVRDVRSGGGDCRRGDGACVRRVGCSRRTAAHRACSPSFQPHA